MDVVFEDILKTDTDELMMMSLSFRVDFKSKNLERRTIIQNRSSFSITLTKPRTEVSIVLFSGFVIQTGKDQGGR